MFSAPLKCPRCKLINPPDAQVCDCGHILGTPNGKKLQAIARDRKQSKDLLAAQRKIDGALIEMWLFTIAGIFCFGIILEPIAFKKALDVRDTIRSNPELKGERSAQRALWISGLILGFWAVSLLALIVYALVLKLTGD